MGYGRGELDADDIDAALLDGTMLLLVFCRGGEYLAAVVAELVDKPRYPICHIVAAGGRDSDDWLDVWWDSVQELAREQGARQIFVSGRKGWERKLKPYGFEHAYTVIARDI